MINMTAVLITFIIAGLFGIGLLIAIIGDACSIIRDYVLDIMEKYFPSLYYYDYDDEA